MIKIEIGGKIIKIIEEKDLNKLFDLIKEKFDVEKDLFEDFLEGLE